MQPAAVDAKRDVHRTPKFTALSDWLFALSTANILFLRTWAALLEPNRNIVPASFLMVMLNVILVAVCLRLGYWVVQRTRTAIVRWAGILAFAALWLVPVHALTTIHFADDVPKRNLTYLLGFILCAAIAISQKVRHGVVKLTIIAAPTLAITFGQSLAHIWSYDAARWQGPAIPTAGVARSPRLVWLLFDEWDYGLTFAARRAGFRLPEIDRLLEESFQATNALPPEHSTLKSVPRLVTGDWTATAGNMHTRNSVFARAKQEELRTAVVGWFVDYCGSFGSSLDACWKSAAMDAERNSMGASVAEMGITQVRYLFENQFRSPFGQPIGAKRQSLDYRFNLRFTLQATASPGFDLVYVHFNVPHEPLFYDAASGRHDLGEKPITAFFRKDFSRYLDALQLVDRTVGEVRRAMTERGVWNNTHLLITSDHAYRFRHMVDGVQNDVRVPFIIRVAGASQPASYEGRFHTILAPDLAMALLHNEVRTPMEIRDWIDQRAKTSFQK